MTTVQELVVIGWPYKCWESCVIVERSVGGLTSCRQRGPYSLTETDPGGGRG